MMKNSAVLICCSRLFGSVWVFKSGNQLSLSVITLTTREDDHGLRARFAHKELSSITIWPACCGQCWVYLFVKKMGIL